MYVPYNYYFLCFALLPIIAGIFNINMLPIDNNIELNGWLYGVSIITSPNWDQRPPNTIIDLLVIHSISLPPGEFGGMWIDALFQNNLDINAHPAFVSLQNLRVSAHLLIRRDGTITQYVPFHARAWHAGASHFQGRTNCNDFSIGIELEGYDTIPFTTIQYITLIKITRLLQHTYPTITQQHIVGHSDIAPGRKTDPGPLFNWQFYLEAIKHDE